MNNDKQVSEQISNYYHQVTALGLWMECCIFHNYMYSGQKKFFCSIPDVNREMQLSEMGEIVFALWKLIPQNFPFATLDEFVIMPNHIHGIIIIDKNDGYRSRCTINRASTNVENGGITGN